MYRNQRCFLLAVFAVGCSSGPAKPTETPVAQPDAPSTSRAQIPLKTAMQEHWGLAVWIRDAVIAGQLDEVPQAAGLLTTSEPEAVPDWTPFVGVLQERALQAQHAETLEEVALATSGIAETCGNCHRETGAVLQLPTEAEPPPSNEPRSHMSRHGWAINSMWVGLVAPSDAAWLAGATVLDDRPLHDDEYFKQWLVTPDVVRLGTKVHDLGLAAAAAEPAARASVYAKLLATCAECHSLLQAGP